MTVAHRTLEGDWAACPAPDVCALQFHFEDLSLAELQAAPLELLLPLFEVLDPPTDVEPSGNRYWLNEAGFSHRAYDLPAVVLANGNCEWWYDGYMHRDHDRPAYVDVRGVQLWYQQEQLHRTAGPAVINTTGEPIVARTRGTRGGVSVKVRDEEYWLRGQHLSHEDWLQVVRRSAGA